MQDPDIAMVGCGNMGAALAAGYLTAVPHGRLLAIDPDVPRSRTLLPAGASVRIEASIEALDAVVPGMVVLAVKPQMMAGILPALARLPGSKGLVVSIAAGIGVATLRAHLPEARIVRAMPNTPALVGEGFTALFGEPSVGADDRARCGILFDAPYPGAVPRTSSRSWRR